MGSEGDKSGSKSKNKETDDARTGRKTKLRLALTPFESAAELKAAQEKIKMEVWTETERARQRRELIQLDEYKYVKDAFEHGWVTETAAEGKGSEIVKIRSDEAGVIRISLNPDFTVNADRAKLASELVQGLSASYAPIFYQAIGVLPVARPTGVDSIRDTNSK